MHSSHVVIIILLLLVALGTSSLRPCRGVVAIITGRRAGKGCKDFGFPSRIVDDVPMAIFNTTIPRVVKELARKKIGREVGTMEFFALAS